MKAISSGPNEGAPLGRTCSVDGCARKHVGRGFCAKHYQAARKNGMEPLAPNPAHHILDSVDMDEMTANCLACGGRVPIRKLNSRKWPECESNLLAVRRANRKRELERNREGYNAYHRAYQRLRKYGFATAPGALEGILERAGGVCEICSTALTVSTMRIHHDHACCTFNKWGDTACGECFRGVLCNRCNSGLGALGDNEAGLKAALAYITRERPSAYPADRASEAS